MAALVFLILMVGVFSTLIFVSGQSPVVDPDAPKPHIVVFLIDDMGWANIGFRNPGNVITPNMDSLASQGVILDRHYTFWYCSPSRSSLMSGRLPLHVSEANDNAGSYMGAVPVNMTMIPAKLKLANYSTHHVGKWDLGNIREALIPVSRGFDSAFGYLQAEEDHFTQENGGCGCRQEVAVDLMNNTEPAYGLNGTYGDYMYSAQAVNMIEQHDPTVPFFLYAAMQVMHAPQEVPDKYYNMYNDSYSDDYRIEQGMASFADEALGNITNALKDKGMWENTLLIVLSDNGGPTSKKVSGSSANNYPLRGGKATCWEGGVRINAFISGGFVPETMVGKVLDGYVHNCDWYTTLCALAGVDSSDDSPGMPPVDGHNMWPYLSGANATSPRIEIPLASGRNGALIMGQYKLIRGKQEYAFWQGPVYPNSTTDHKHEPSYDCGKGCLFDIFNDPGEHNNLNLTDIDRHGKMLERAKEIDKSLFNPDRGSGNETLCCEYIFEHRGFSGPYLP